LPLIDIARSIEDTLTRVQPEVVYTHLIHDLNIDHRRVAEATLIAARPKCYPNIHKILSYEIPVISDWSFGQLGGVVAPDVYEDVSESHMGAKVATINEYGKLGLFKSGRHEHRGSRIYAELRGSQIGLKLAEAFELIWERNIIHE
jgi:LmbE family N-acetylglucosaminyl deacetylase